MVLKLPETSMAGTLARCAVGLTRCAGEEGKDTFTCAAAAGQADNVGGLNRMGGQSCGGPVCWEFVIDTDIP